MSRMRNCETILRRAWPRFSPYTPHLNIDYELWSSMPEEQFQNFTGTQDASRPPAPGLLFRRHSQ
jgi:hypothetical protein